MEWRRDDDCFTFSSNLFEKPNNKRGILSIVSQVYDHLGFLAPFLLKAKVLMQRACEKVQKWGEEVSADFAKDWKAHYLPKIENQPKWEAPWRNIKVGDLVVIVDNNEPRNSWKTGVVVAVHQGSDGLVRKISIMIGTADVDTSD